MSNDANGFEMFVENGSGAGGSSAAGSGGAAGAAGGVCADFERASSTGTSSADGGKSGNAREQKGVHPAQRLATSAAICSQVHQAPLDTCILESSARAPMIRNCTDVVKEELDDICNILRQGCSETCPAKECAALLHRLGNEAEPGKRE